MPEFDPSGARLRCGINERKPQSKNGLYRKLIAQRDPLDLAG